MDATLTRATTLQGSLRLPADKAICHRAALLSAISDGTTRIIPWSTAEDCRRTVEVLRELGVPMVETREGLEVAGVGLHGLRAPTEPLDCGESGTTIRLSCGLLAGQPFTGRLTAAASLCQRPMRRVVEPLSQMGATIEGASRASSSEVYPPLTVQGRRPLHGISYAPPVASAQVKSAVLLAGLYADGPTTVSEPAPTRDHTERLLQALGVQLVREGSRLTVHPPRRALAAVPQLAVPGDPSSAAFFIVAAASLPGSRLVIRDVGLNPTRTAFVEVLRRMGAAIDVEAHDQAWEPRGTLTVESAQLHGTTVTAKEVPLLIDEVPILVVAACVAEGQTRFEGVGELRVKETDRLHSMVTGLKAMGAGLVASPDGSLVVQGGRPLHHATVESFGDHRTAMSLAVAGLLAEGQTRVRGVECVAKSLGNFFELLASVVGSSIVKVG
ncbi:MAG: 3-phosphoshikimate 1-carboxyvinyltransferase [Candidatus Omnitrophica bacterium]|nr:3-phosphoshikimate 1-carboxyvinyltransferase [Candidatus Omnitrophota bacterium]